ncbi:MAG: acetyltransferase [Candidatus Thermoplasmatota archaeon]
MARKNNRKKMLDRKRTEWRKKHRTLNGKVILYPDKPPEHVNARANKTYNWFWKKILLTTPIGDIPAIISTIKEQIKHEKDGRKTRVYRTMIGMAEDAYKLKSLDGINDFDSDLQFGEKSVYDASIGLIFKNGTFYSSEFNEEENTIIIRDQEGVVVDVQYNGKGEGEKKTGLQSLKSLYKDWEYVTGT